nr:hypothetical protein [Tanacetum cinerariifolium]
MTYMDFDKNMGTENRSFASILNAGSGNPNKATEPSLAIVLDDDCRIERDYYCSLMGKIKDINALPNLYMIVSNEGFENVKLTYLGGLWILLDTDLIETKEKVFNHVGVSSWFSGLQSASNSFICDERIIWIFIKGLPIKAINHNTFSKIASFRGELTNVDDSENTTLTYNRLCVKVKSSVIINDIIKVIVKGNIFWIQVKELEPCPLTLMKNKKITLYLEMIQFVMICCMNENNMVYNHIFKSLEFPGKSFDPFGIYNLFEKNKDKVVLEENKDHVASDKFDPQFPPGFTPVVENVNAEEVNSFKEPHPKENLYDANEIETYDFSKLKGISLIKPGASILDVMDELIKVGRAMGYNMDGCLGQKAKKGWIQELNLKNHVSFVALQETKMESIDLFSIKALWGNFDFDYEGECVLLSDFNEVRLTNERYGTVFNTHGVNAFNNFISMAILVDLPLEGYSFTWAHKSASKMSKLDRSQLAIYGVLVDGGWVVDPFNVKEEFLNHFSNRFADPNSPTLVLESHFPTILSSYQISDLESDVSYEEIKKVVRDCDINKSLGPNGYTFDFFRRYWKIIDVDVVAAILQFFSSCILSPGCNLSFIALILKMQGAKVVKDFRLIRLIGLKQGDPLSPFLFILIMESLHLSFKNVVHSSLYKGIQIDDSLMLSHSFYADDVVFVGKWDKQNVDMIVNVLKCFFLASGLKINLHKNVALGRRLLAMYGMRGALDRSHSLPARNSPWIDIIREVIRLFLKGEFSMKSVRFFIDDSLLPKADVPTRWVKAMPIKINIFGLRVSLDKLSTRLNLSLQGVDIPSIQCPLYSISVESSSHLLFSYHLACSLMHKVVRWWDLDV